MLMDRPLLRRDRLPCDGQLFAYQDDEQRDVPLLPDLLISSDSSA